MADSFQQRIELQGVEDILAQLKAMGDEGSKAFAQLKQSLEKTNPALQDLSKQSALTREQFKQLGLSITDLSGLIAPFSSGLASLINVFAAFAGPVGIGAAIAGLALFVKNMADSIVQLDRQARALGLSTEQMAALTKITKEAGGTTDELTTALVRMSRQIATEATAQLKGLIDLAKNISPQGKGPKFINVQDTIAELDNLKTKVQQVAPQLKELFTQSGDRRGMQSVQQLADSIFKVAKNTDDAGLKMRKLIDAAAGSNVPLTPFERLDKLLIQNSAELKSLGVSFLDAKGNTVDFFEAIKRIADAFAKLPEGAQKTALAAKLAGRGFGPEFLDAVSKAKGGIDGVVDALRKQGTVIDQETIAKARALRSSYAELESSSKKLGVTLVEIFAPPLTAGIKGFNDSLTELRANSKESDRELSLGFESFKSTMRNVGEDAQAIWQKVSGAAGDAAKFIGNAFDFQSIRATFRNLSEDLSRAWTGLVAAAGNAATFIGSAFNSAVQSVKSAFSNLGNALSGAFSGITGTIGQIAASIGSAFANAFQSIRSTLRNLASDAGTVWTAIVTSAQSALQSLGAAFTNAFQSIRSAFSSIGSGLGSIWDGLVSSAQNAVSSIVGIFAGIGTNIGQAWEAVKQSASQAFEDIKNAAITSIQGIASGAAGALGGLAETLVAPFRSAVATIVSLWDGLIAKIKSALSLGSSSAAAGAAAGEGGGSGFASGGFVWGSGTATSDSIIARLSRGEFVINARAVAHFGRDFFAALNALRPPAGMPGAPRISLGSLSVMPRFSLGGLVDGMQRSLSALVLPGFAQGGFVDMASAGAGRPLHPVTINFPGQSISGVLAPTDVVDKLRRAAVSAQVARGGTKPDWYR